MCVLYCRCRELLHIVADSTTVMQLLLLDRSTMYILLAVSLAMMATFEMHSPLRFIYFQDPGISKSLRLAPPWLQLWVEIGLVRV